MIVDQIDLKSISFQEVAAVSVTNLRCLRGALPLKGRRLALQPRRPLIQRQTEAGTIQAFSKLLRTLKADNYRTVLGFFA